MQWLTQNWIWIALGVGALFLMTRMGCGVGSSGGRHHSHDSGRDDTPAASDSSPNSHVDPVSGRPVTRTGTPVSTVFHGHAYYFENRQNRDAFEASPEKYVRSPAGLQDQDRHEQHRHHGC